MNFPRQNMLNFFHLGRNLVKKYNCFDSNEIEIVNTIEESICEGIQNSKTSRIIFMAPQNPTFVLKELKSYTNGLLENMSSFKTNHSSFIYLFNGLKVSEIKVDSNEDSRFRYVFDNVFQLVPENIPSSNWIHIYPHKEIAQVAYETKTKKGNDIVTLNYDLLSQFGFNPIIHLTLNERHKLSKKSSLDKKLRSQLHL